MTSRRAFLKGSAVAIFGVGAIPAWLSRSVYAASGSPQRRKILVAIFQRFAVDGLNMVVPFGEQRYYELRPSIAVPKPDGTPQSAIDLDGFFGLHPSLAPLKPMFDAAASGDRGSGRLSRSHSLAFRRAGLHGIRHARFQRNGRRLDESRFAEADGPGVAGTRSELGIQPAAYFTRTTTTP